MNTEKKLTESPSEKPITVSELRSQSPDRILKLPSGMMVKVKRPRLYELIDKGVFKFTLMNQMEKLSGKFTKKADNTNSDGIDDKEFKSMLNMFYGLATVVVIEPKVMFDKDAEEAGLSIEDYIDPSYFDFPDLTFLWENTVNTAAGGKEMLPFRREQGQPAVTG